TPPSPPAPEPPKPEIGKCGPAEDMVTAGKLLMKMIGNQYIDDSSIKRCVGSDGLLGRDDFGALELDQKLFDNIVRKIGRKPKGGHTFWIRADDHLSTPHLERMSASDTVDFCRGRDRSGLSQEDRKDHCDFLDLQDLNKYLRLMCGDPIRK